ncbi:MAG: peptidase M14, partial [Bacteroidetes bacterium]|nr:peptidase M14 [Bacteroidota bacterium]
MNNLLRFGFFPKKLFFSIVICLLASAAMAQIPHPKDVFGFTPGDDYKLATTTQLQDYFQKLDAASDRVMMREIGKSVLGKPMLLLFISSEENLKELDKWRDISEKLARARVDEETAQQLAATGKSIVWIDGGLHATEVAGAQMTPLLAHRVVTEETPEMQKIRENTILLLMPIMNPDGLDIVASWYKQNLKTPFELTRPPWLYHHYIGHDNNRDWFMNNMPESEAVTNVLYNEWYPQIVYNHHQTGPSWTRIFIPPFADPVNPHIHPGVTTGVNMVGTAMANRFAMKKMDGAVSRVIYSMWWNGGMRTVPYYHNMIGILTETSHATPSPRYYAPDSIPKSIGARRGEGHPTNGTNVFYPAPWKGGKSTFSQPVSYMITASMAVLRAASDMREQWLYNIYAMGRDAIESGNNGEIKSFIIPSQQWNQGEEIALVNLLKLGGVEISRAKSDFTIGENTYSAGSFIIPTNQAFRPYIMDLLTKQTYPERKGEDGQPETPYDLAGWTLPMQMGIRVDAHNEPISIKAEPEPLPAGALSPVAGTVTGKPGFGYLFSNHPNASVLAANRLIKGGQKVYRSNQNLAEKFGKGTFIVEGKGKEKKKKIEKIAAETGV